MATRSPAPVCRSIAFSAALLLVPLFAIYVAQFVDPSAPKVETTDAISTPPAARSISLNAPALPTVETEPVSPQTFYVTRENGQYVYKIRMTGTGDELTVCAQTGKLLAVGSKPFDPMNPMETSKKS